MQKEEFTELVRQAVMGDEEAFVKICEIKSKDILYICIRLMGNRHDAEDAAQEIILHIRDHLHELQSPEAFHVWLYRIINGTCIKMRRKSRRMMTRFEEEPLVEDRMEFLPQEFAENEEKRAVILSILDKLPYKQRTCMLMYYYERFSYREIAAALGISEKDVSNTLYQAKKKINKKLEKMPDTRKFLKKIYTVAPLPVMTQILMTDRDIEVIGNYAKELLDPQVIAAGGAAIGGRIGKLLAMNTGEASGTAGAVTTKAAIGVAITAGSAVIGTTAYMSQNQVPEIQESPVIVEEEEPLDEPEFHEEPVAEPIDFEEEIELPVESLEDMVGYEEADQLRAFSMAEETNSSELHTMLNDIGIDTETAETNWNPTTGEQCTLYILEKQDKKLAVLTKRSDKSSSCQMAFKFIDIDETLPEDIELFLEFEEWREQQEDYEE